jgi:hypothetical protein
MVLFGAIAMLLNSREQRLQERRTDDGGLTFIDALYLATVTACTIGYGHAITPQSDSAKGFFVFYMFASTYVVGKIIGELSGLHITIKEDAIAAVLIDSTTWVHKADLDGDGKVTEADYVLFKLQQMQKVKEMLGRRPALWPLWITANYTLPYTDHSHGRSTALQRFYCMHVPKHLPR